MAFGFRRLPGASRRYEAVNAEGYEPGAVLSRRQYDAAIERAGKRSHLPGFDQIRAAERRLEALADQLDRSARAQQSEFEREAAMQARASAATERARLAEARTRRTRQGVGQRRYNALLKAFRAEKKRQGKPASYREAQRSPELRGIVAAMKGKPNPKGDPNIADENRFNRLKALQRLGGDQVFREMYNRFDGGRTQQRGRQPQGPRIRSPGQGVRRAA